MSRSDPRLFVIGKRLKEVHYIIPVMSPKGGVGKTIISTTLALLASKDMETGLLDLDITNPTAHIVLGVDPFKTTPKEEKGVHPPLVGNLKFMSIAYYTSDKPLPLRGWEIDNVVREILAITIWGRLDILFIDTPPGISDEILDTLNYFTSLRPVIVTTPSPLALEATRKLFELLNDYGVRVLGVIENMANKPSKHVKQLVNMYKSMYLGNIPYIRDIDSYIGDLGKLLNSPIARDLQEVLSRIKNLL